MSLSWVPDSVWDFYNDMKSTLYRELGNILPDEIPLLTLLMVIPLLGAVFSIFVSKHAKTIAAVFSGITMVMVLGLYVIVPDLGTLNENYVWIETLGIKINYALGLDALSVMMVGLTAVLVFLVVIFSTEKERPGLFFAMLMAMEVGLMGVYMAQDYFLFYIMWEVTLIPMYFMISWFGGPRRHYASIKFFIYTHVASLIMLIGIFAMVFNAGIVSGGVADFSFEAVKNASSLFSDNFQMLVFALMFFGFAVKMPVVPFHTWLPDAHVEAPTAGSVLLAGVMLKMGSYGIIRICLESLMKGAEQWQELMIVVAIVSIIYGAYACIAQKDLKKMIAFSSISHMGMVLLGIAVLNEAGLTFAIFQMFAHGLITAVLFMVCGITGHNVGTREIPLLGGLAGKMPKYAGFMVFGFLASLGLPGLVGFVAEFGIMFSFYEYLQDINMVYLIVVVLLSLMLTAGYYMWAMQRTIFGRLTKKVDLSHAHDINSAETFSLAVLCLLIVLFGVCPSIVSDVAGQYIASSGVFI
jgi:proton-translocating NADH-quinone oxidoreductase, chain M